MNIELKIGIIRRFGSQASAAKPLGTHEPRLSRLIHGRDLPSAKERKRFAAVLGVDYFAPDGNPVRAEEEHRECGTVG